MSTTAPTSPRFAGLDGLRALAVALVVVYHLFAPVLPGGFIGVDVFFVISGFLITSLLLREHAATGGIRIGEFWRRRARRLLPALALVVSVCATAAWIIGGDVLVGVGAQVLGAATFSYNWISISAGGGYFSADTPELFRNVWSLAVEEQFYVLWPLVLPLFLLMPRRWGRVAAAVGLATASAVWMGIVVTSSSGDVTRAYFGTDTHAFGILLGVALAFGLSGLAARSPLRRAGRAAGGVVGGLAVGGLVALAAVPADTGIATFPGALVAASLLTALAIATAVWPGSWFGARIDMAPLRWIGDRSYGIYLWHWPLLVLAVAATHGAAPDAGVPVATGVAVLLLTLVLAELSYRFVEMPVRRFGLRASLRRLGMLASRGPAGRMRALGAAAAVTIVLGGTSAAIAAAPAESSSESVVAAGRAALEAAAAGAGDTETSPPADGTGGDAAGADDPRASAEPTLAPSGILATPEASAEPAEATEAAEAGPGIRRSDLGPVPRTPASLSPVAEPDPEVRQVPGSEVIAVGDSVMLASAGGLLKTLPGISIDAKVSRQASEGVKILSTLEKKAKLRPYVVVGLGTNGAVDRDSLERMLDIIGPERQLVLVNAYAPRTWVKGVNHEISEFARTHDRVAVADWSKAIGGKKKLLAGDNIHPGKKGGRLFAETIAGAIDDAETAQARAAYSRELTLYEVYQWRPAD